MLPFSSMYLFDDSASSFVDLEFAASDIPGTALPLIEQAADRIYMGLDRTFDGGYFDLTTSGVGYTNPMTWQYYNGTSWVNLPLAVNYRFTEDGVVRFAVPTNWSTVTLNGVESVDTGLQSDDTSSGTAKYWVRVTSTDAPTRVATLRRSFPFPTYAYTTPVDVNGWCQFRSSFSTTTAPSIAEVEAIIRKIEGRIEGYTTHSWKPQIRTNENYEWNRWGFTLKRFPVIQIFSLEIWNGGQFETMVEGRESDYFVDNDTGIVSFARMINMPFAYNRVRSWGYGEFRRAIRVSYIWGKDIDFDDRAYMVRDITTKLVAADIISNYDYTQLIPEGSDRFSLEQKVSYWQEQGQDRLEELRPIRAWVI